MRRRTTVTRLSALAVTAALAVSACTASGAGGNGGATGGNPGNNASGASTGTAAPAITTEASFEAHGSVGQAYVLGANPGQRLVVADGSGTEVGSGTVDDFGALIVRDLAPGDGYTFRAVDGATVAGSKPFKVMAVADHESDDFYTKQDLKQGLNYLTMRDGVQIAATVRLPAGKTLADGPFPTVIEYSGYAVAPPKDGLLAVQGKGDDPLVPSTSTAVGGIIAPLLGYASVSVQMRGSGCSGGAMGLFDQPTATDGYDVIEILGREPWVRNGKVGMVGISFSGISQWGVAGTQPPHLAAIAPFSVTDDLYSVGFPGGIYNNGFAANWLAERVSDAKPAPEGGQKWAQVMIEQEGDKTCEANQKLRLQTQDVQALLKADPTRNPAQYDDRSATVWADKVKVPVFFVGGLQDEQTGGQWPQMIDRLNGNKDVWVTMINGTHVEPLGPATISRWVEFLDLFVADQVPTDRPLLSSFGGQLYNEIAHAPAQAVPPVRFTDAADAEAARAEYRKDPRVRVLFDNGGGEVPGSLGPQWEAGFSSWPPAEAKPTTYYLGGAGQLTSEAGGEGSTVTFRPDPDARPRNSLPKGSAWDALPAYVWAPVTGDIGLGFVSEPLATDTVVVGPASLDLWLSSTAEDTDLQVSVTEVRPDGQEMYVQSGFLRASHRKIDPDRSTELHPFHTYTAADQAPLPAGELSQVRIPIFAMGHAFRAGSQIRIAISAPGGDRPAWEFETPSTGGKVTDTVSLGGAKASMLVLPVVSGVSPTDAPPACPSLRGQPCRTYERAGNGG